MKVLLAGDSHGSAGTIKNYLRVADDKECQFLFVLGDFGYWEHVGDGVDYLDRVNYYAEQYALPVFFLDGNHDKTSLLLEKYHERDDDGFIKVREFVFYSPRGHRWTWEGVRFASFGGAYSVDKAWRLNKELKLRYALNTDTSGTMWFPEEEMSDEDMEKFLTDTSPVDVILAHDKPRASNPDWNRKDLPECWPNQDRLQKAVRKLQPKMFFHGHLHHRYEDEILCGDDKYTKVVGLNADGERGSFYELNLDVDIERI